MSLTISRVGECYDEMRSMGSLSPRLQVRVSQKQILTPGLVQMVSLLQLNRLELKEMIAAEVAQNPVLEDAADGGDELSPEELRPLLEAERVADPADRSILEVTPGPATVEVADMDRSEFEAAGFDATQYDPGQVAG